MRLTNCQEKPSTLFKEQWRNTVHFVDYSYSATAPPMFSISLFEYANKCSNRRGDCKGLGIYCGKKEGLQLPSGFADRLAQQSNRSLRRAILLFETCPVQQYPFTNNQVIPTMDWEEYVSEIASNIFKEQSPKRLFEVRGKLYELLINCIPPEIILKRLVYELLKKLDSELKREISHWAAYYEHRLCLGLKAIIHLEAVVAKFMSIYKGFHVETFG